MTYHPATTALLLVDPYNDFLSEGGKLWPRVKTIAEQVKMLDHLRVLVKVARDKGIKVYFVPHHRWEPGDYVKWDHPTPYQLAGRAAELRQGDMGRHIPRRLPAAAR
jgi:nicotinamidase-related amidase